MTSLSFGNGLIYSTASKSLSSAVKNLETFESRLAAMGDKDVALQEKITFGMLIERDIEPGIEAIESKIAAIKERIAALKNGGRGKE